MYQETESYGNGYRVRYLDGLKHVIEERRNAADAKRDAFMENIETDRESYRKQYLDMLGWPLNEEPQKLYSISECVFYETEEVVYSRMQFEVLEGCMFYGILFRHKSEEPLPLVISQHGGIGTPELCSNFFGSANYNDMTMRVFNRGVNVFAPQLALWESPKFGPDNERDKMDMQLKQLGSSIAAVEIYAIMRCLDYFEMQSYCNRVFGMTGLSYGGFYTLYTAAADVRIKASLACSHYNDRFLYGWTSKNFKNAGNTFFDAEVAALVCPRYLGIEVGDNDELFLASAAEAEYERGKRYYRSAPDQFDFHVFRGVHEYCPEDDAAVEKMIEKLKK